MRTEAADWAWNTKRLVDRSDPSQRDSTIDASTAWMFIEESEGGATGKQDLTVLVWWKRLEVEHRIGLNARFERVLHVDAQ